MPFSGKWMKLEVIILIEISQSHKEEYSMFSLTCVSCQGGTGKKQGHECGKERGRRRQGKKV
jgi:hypothetical protein